MIADISDRSLASVWGKELIRSLEAMEPLEPCEGYDVYDTLCTLDKVTEISILPSKAVSKSASNNNVQQQLMHADLCHEIMSQLPYESSEQRPLDIHATLRQFTQKQEAEETYRRKEQEERRCDVNTARSIQLLTQRVNQLISITEQVTETVVGIQNVVEATRIDQHQTQLRLSELVQRADDEEKLRAPAAATQQPSQPQVLQMLEEVLASLTPLPTIACQPEPPVHHTVKTTPATHCTSTELTQQSAAMSASPTKHTECCSKPGDIIPHRNIFVKSFEAKREALLQQHQLQTEEAPKRFTEEHYVLNEEGSVQATNYAVTLPGGSQVEVFDEETQRVLVVPSNMVVITRGAQVYLSARADGKVLGRELCRTYRRFKFCRWNEKCKFIHILDGDGSTCCVAVNQPAMQPPMLTEALQSHAVPAADKKE